MGIDSVDDESRPEGQGLFYPDNSSAIETPSIPNPEEWTACENPPYGYWMYYLYANLCILNQLRAARGMTNFQFRPHCGEAGTVFGPLFEPYLSQSVTPFAFVSLLAKGIYRLVETIVALSNVRDRLPSESMEQEGQTSHPYVYNSQ